MKISPAPFRGLLFSRAEQLKPGEDKRIGGGNSCGNGDLFLAEAEQLFSTLPPWKPILPFVLPQRCAVRSLPRPWRGPHAVCASTSIISPSASSPAARQSLSKLADMLASASIFNSLAGIAVDVISLFMALLS